MATFLIDRHSPFRAGVSPKLRHRSSPISESGSHNGSTLSPSSPNNDISTQANGRDHGVDKKNEVNFQEKKTVKNKSIVSYFVKELTKDYKLEGDASEFVERRDRVYTSVNTPINLEKFCAFGFLQCLDSILYMVTFLPLRIIVALFRVLTYPCTVVFMGRRQMLDGAQVCDILKGIILAVSCIVTSYMDMSLIYHEVRRQNIIKFYVLYNMLDVLDKLVSGFGQDVLDSLYWTAVEPRGRKREHFGTIFHLIFAIVYVVVHTLIILVQAVILNVAFNSKNNNLLTIIMSNNFIEIKANLFKRLDKNHLCQITYSDVKERFHYIMMLLYVFIRNANDKEGSWDYAYPILSNAVIVMFVEIIVDWVKHAFITKSNELSASLYADFALGLAQDIASSQKKHAFTNFSDQVCRRMGFTPIPLICVVFMVCSTSFNISGPLPWLLFFLFYLCLMSTKILSSIILLGWAQRLINQWDRTTKHTGTVVNSQVIPKKEEKGPQTKIKVEPDAEKPLVVPITTHPKIASSSIAVNTDSISLSSSTIPSDANTSISSFQDEHPVLVLDRKFIIHPDNILDSLPVQDHEVTAVEDGFIAMSDEGSCLRGDDCMSIPETNTDFHQGYLLDPVSNSISGIYVTKVNVNDQPNICDIASAKTVKSVLANHQTNVITNYQTVTNSVNGDASFTDKSQLVTADVVLPAVSPDVPHSMFAHTNTNITGEKPVSKLHHSYSV